MKRSEIFFSALLVPLDALFIATAFLLSYLVRDRFHLISPELPGEWATKLQYDPSIDLSLTLGQLASYSLFIIPGFIAVFAIFGLYAIRNYVGWTQRLARIVMAVTVSEGFILLLFLLKKDFFLPRSFVLYSWIFSIVIVALGRFLVRQIQRFLYRYNIGAIHLAVIGKVPAAYALIEELGIRSHDAYRLVLHLENENIAEIIKKLDGQHLDEVVVLNESYSAKELAALRGYCLQRSIGFSFVPSLLIELQGNIVSANLAGLPVITVRPTPLDGWGRVAKRLFDLVVGSIFSLLFLPVFLIIALVMKITSPGPLFYKHKRIGKGNRVIYVWKFRSMKWEYCTGVGHNGDDAFAKLLAANPAMQKEWSETHKLKNDPRVTAIGSLLRKTSLDELPQLWNVLSGELSLVGPRPIVQDEVEKYGDASPLLFSVKPGLTGLWQVSGRTNTTYEERVALDLRYIEHWSMWQDVVILLKTTWVLLAKGTKSAY